MSDSRTLAPGAWRQEGDHAVLLATRCGRCGTTTFPPTRACPRCWERVDLAVEPLSPRGTVYAFTVTHVPAPGIEAPYAVAYVDLPEGVRVCGRLAAWEGVRVGDAVEVVPGVLRDGPDGVLRGWLFRATAEAGAKT